MQKQPTVLVYLAEAGFTVALGEQTNLHLRTNGRVGGASHYGHNL